MCRFIVLFAACVASTAAQAQLDLPGAATPAPVGTVTAPRTATPARRHPASPRLPSTAAGGPAEAALAGKTLALDGGKSQITFAARDKTVDVSRLVLDGTRVANGGTCQVEVPGLPLAPVPLDKENGTTRFTLAIPACPLTVSVLDGAVLTSAAAATCTFKEADCQARVTGLWGAQPGAIGPDEVKAIERERTAAERAVRAAYKGLVSSTKDRPTIRGYASDQAGFSSYREETCRDYIGESRHGFCASRLTQARAVTLEAELVVAAAAKEERRRKKAERAGRR